MTYQEKSIHCSDCGTVFTFTAGEQEFYASKGFTNEPKRCVPCRAARKTQRNGDGADGADRAYAYRSSRS
ncbi:MAG: hypothetical protein A2147_07230 [Chloroflexi bacterium RBG_16_57_8]|nr:MAG: hypothetical protein A2147_07230 [Chloroflexi bacterium RBG_16_57_8]